MTLHGDLQREYKTARASQLLLTLPQLKSKLLKERDLMTNI